MTGLILVQGQDAWTVVFNGSSLMILWRSRIHVCKYLKLSLWLQSWILIKHIESTGNGFWVLVQVIDVDGRVSTCQVWGVLVHINKLRTRRNNKFSIPKSWLRKLGIIRVLGVQIFHSYLISIHISRVPRCNLLCLINYILNGIFLWFAPKGSIFFICFLGNLSCRWIILGDFGSVPNLLRTRSTTGSNVTFGHLLLSFDQSSISVIFFHLLFYFLMQFSLLSFHVLYHTGKVIYTSWILLVKVQINEGFVGMPFFHLIGNVIVASSSESIDFTSSGPILFKKFEGSWWHHTDEILGSAFLDRAIAVSHCFTLCKIFKKVLLFLLESIVVIQ